MELSELGTSFGASIRKGTQDLGSLVPAAVSPSDIWACPRKVGRALESFTLGSSTGDVTCSLSELGPGLQRSSGAAALPCRAAQQCDPQELSLVFGR